MEIISDSCPSTHFPVAHKSISLDIKGNKTDIVICKYDDNFLVMVTQIGCMGTILRARYNKLAGFQQANPTYNNSLSAAVMWKEESVSVDPTFNVSVVFGKRDEPYLVACARQLIEHISSCGSSRPLVLSLGLKDHSPGTLKDIISAVIDNRLW